MIVRYILDGHIPIPEPDFLKWGAWFETADRGVKRTVLDTGEEVSTVFLALDHNFSGKGSPLLFETLVFGGLFDGHMFRHATWEEAEAFHNRFLEAVAKGTEAAFLDGD